MNEPQPLQEPYPGYQPRRFPWGCLLGSCLGVVLLMVGGIALTGFLGYRFYMSQISQYTSETPVELPKVDLSPEEIAAVENRVEDFKTQLEEGEAVEPFVLTEIEVNALISREENFRDRFYVTIDNDQITAEVSFPTDMFPGAKGRYFNGEAVLDASLENGVLIVKADKASVNGQPVPEEYMREIRKENLAKDAYKDPESAEWLRKFESMKVVGKTIVLTPAKPKPVGDSSAAAAEGDSSGTGERGERGERGETGETGEAGVAEASNAEPQNP